MAKTRDTPITAADLVEYLDSQDDFALELSVYHDARMAGLSATHGGNYEDPITSKPRQFDIRAHFEWNSRRVDLAIECKCLKPSYPLLLLRIPRAPSESFHDIVWSYTDEGRVVIAPSLPTKTIPARDADSMYKPGHLVAKSLAQVGRTEKGEFVSSDAETYEKWSQALASAHGLVLDAATHRRRYKVDDFLTYVWPILVVPDGTLWAADFADDGSMQKGPHPITEASLFVGHAYTGLRHPVTRISHLHILSRTSVAKLFHDVGQRGDIWESIFPDNCIPDTMR